MAKLTAVQIAAYARSAGFSGNNLVIAIAVAFAESTGSTTALNKRTKCAGLWQIHPIHQRSHKSWTRSWLYQPGNNAKAAWVISNKGKNWRPWEAYTNGSYRKYLSTARKAAASAGSSAKNPTAIPATKTKVVRTGVTVAKVLALAASQIGYTERPSNRTKYWTDLKINQGQPWCGGFVTWCLWKSGYSMTKIKSMMGSNPYHVWSIKAAAIKKGRWTKTPKPGYMAIFTYSHIEIVEKVLSSNYVQTIGGNTSGGSRGSQNNGGGVYRRKRSRKSIQGYVRIDYDVGGTVTTYVTDNGDPAVDPKEAPKPDMDAKGILNENGVFNVATSAKLAQYFGMNINTGLGAEYWKRIEKVADFPIKYQDGVIDTETVQFLQWATKQAVNGVWNKRCIENMQKFLNKFTNKEEPNYATMIAGWKKRL